MTDTRMRILTVKQPWAHAIIQLGKDVENRGRNIAKNFGPGPLAIHAGMTWYENGDDLVEDIATEIRGTAWLTPWPLPAGAIVGLVDLVEVHHYAECVDIGSYHDHGDGTGCQRVDACSRWADQGDVHHLVLANPRPLSEPIVYRGFQGMRWLDLDVAAEVLRRVR